MHGVVMVWFFLIPSIPTTLGNFLMPLMIGAHDLAFPRLNLAQLVSLQPVGSGVALLSLHRRRRHRLDLLPAVFDRYSNALMSRRGAGGFYQRLFDDHDGAQFRRDDPPTARSGDDLDRLPLFIWAIYAVSVVMLMATPVLAMSLLLLGARAVFRHSGCSIRRSAATRSCGSTCSGSTRTPPSTSWYCRPWASSAN